MADIRLLYEKIKKWEGFVFVDDPTDMGGATKGGVTLATWQAVGYDKNHDGHIDAEDVKLLTEQDVMDVLHNTCWKAWRADEINSQLIANILVDWVWGSGAWGIKIPQRLLGVKDDGSVGPLTLKAINDSDESELFDKIFEARMQFLYDIVKAHPEQNKFLKGWVNRLADFRTVPNLAV